MSDHGSADIFPLFDFRCDMHAFLCRRLWKPYNKVYSIVLLPLLGLLLLPDFSQYHNGVTRQEIIVNAPIQDVFASINNIQQIQSSEIKFSPIFLMGFPKPISGMTEQTDNGLIRQIYWQRGIHFKKNHSVSCTNAVGLDLCF